MALPIQTALEEKFNLNANDYINAAIVKWHCGLQEASLQDCDEVLRLDPLNIIGLNNKGYFLNIMGRYEDAMALFDEAIAINPQFAYSYNNRGLAKIKMRDPEGGFTDIQYSLQLEPNNALAYRNLGIYYLSQGNKAAAREAFYKARELESDLHLLEDLIVEATV